MRFLPMSAAVALSTLLAMPLAMAQSNSGQKMDNSDAAALKQLAQANLNEVDAGKAAANKAQNPQVKQFAQKMVSDHQQMYDELKQLAQAKGVALPQSAAAKDKAEMMMMEKSSGADFDKKYMDHMVKEHQKDVKETQNIAAKAKDPDFKAAVEKANSKIKEHLAMAQRIAGQTSAAGGSSSSKGKRSSSSAGGSVDPHTDFSNSK
jgi:putative membrane protein